MKSTDPQKRPTAQACKEAFANIDKLAQKFIDEPDNQLLQNMGKNLVALEVYLNAHKANANMQKSVGQKLGLTADQHVKSEMALDLMKTITEAFSAEPVDIEQLNAKMNELQKRESNSKGLFSSSGKLQGILDDIKASVHDYQTEISETKNL